ncbi:FxSxx-COOH system tetratricopeptide repeat protein [Streptomyces sp. NPDC085937]|uniref:FxSxx-COOH system tetratricopeptide repeat protein n=1 Tax=Streptomyces sp. NPDC085937 TaxID=3365742 RepID=UPI0037D06F59
MYQGSEGRIDPSQASNKEDLARFMRMIRAQADSPSYRDLEKSAAAQGKGRSLPRTTLGEVLRGRKFPSKAFLLTFVELCGAEPGEVQVWETTWNRLAVQYKVSEPATRSDESHAQQLARARQRTAELEEQCEQLLALVRRQSQAVERAAHILTVVGAALQKQGHWAEAEAVFDALTDLQQEPEPLNAQPSVQVESGLAEVMADSQARSADQELAAKMWASDDAIASRVDHRDTLAAQQPHMSPRATASALPGADEPQVAAVAGPVAPIRPEAFEEQPPRPPFGERVAGGLPAIWNLEPRNPEFIGRDLILHELFQRFDRGGASVVQALRGPGGVGKTQIAVEYAHRHADNYDLVWWLAAEDSSLVGEQLAALAVELRLVEKSTDTATAAAVVKSHLRGRDRWLLIFDNTEERTSVSQWLPGGPGHVLITSRAGGWERVATTVPVDVMGESESVDLLRTHCPELRQDEAEALAEELDYLPLALCQAGGFLAETATEVGDYLNLLNTHPAALLNEGEAGDYPRSLAAVIGLSLDQLTRADPVGLATVHVCALLAAESIPVRWLMAVDDITADDDGVLAALAHVSGDGMALRRAIATAVRFGLAKSNRGGVRLHRLVQGVVRDLLSPTARERVRRHARALLVANSPGDPEDPASWPEWARIVPHLLAVEPTTPTDLHLRALACNTAWYLIERGDADAGARLAQSLRDSWRRDLGPDDVHVLWATRCMARALREQGRYEEARSLYDDALPRYHRVMGKEHTDSLRLAHGSAINLRLLGRYEAARALQEETLNTYRSVLGEDHPHTLHSANHLAVDLGAMGHHDEARRLHEDTLARYRRVLGDDHPDTLRSANHLAADLLALGQYAEARVLDEDTLERCRHAFGEEHPYTLRAATSYATVQRNLGHLQEALRLQEATLARSHQILGTDHPQSLRAAQALSEILHHLHRLDRAEQLQEETVHRYRRMLGDQHPETRQANDLLQRINQRRLQEREE